MSFNFVFHDIFLLVYSDNFFVRQDPPSTCYMSHYFHSPEKGHSWNLNYCWLGTVLFLFLPAIAVDGQTPQTVPYIPGTFS